MSQDFDIYLEDILEAIDRIQEYVQDVTRETFEGDRMRIDAVIRNLEVIGEAVKQVPDSVRENIQVLHGGRLLGRETFSFTNILMSTLKSSGVWCNQIFRF